MNFRWVFIFARKQHDTRGGRRERGDQKKEQKWTSNGLTRRANKSILRSPLCTGDHLDGPGGSRRHCAFYPVLGGKGRMAWLIGRIKRTHFNDLALWSGAKRSVEFPRKRLPQSGLTMVWCVEWELFASCFFWLDKRTFPPKGWRDERTPTNS